MSASWKWAKANPDAAARRIRDLERELTMLKNFLAREYHRVAPVVPDFPATEWIHLGEGQCRGNWAEDGSPYSFFVPHQLVPCFFALQPLARLCKEARAALDAARKEGGAT